MGKTRGKKQSETLLPLGVRLTACVRLVVFNGTVRVVVVVEGGVEFIIASVCAPSRLAYIYGICCMVSEGNPKIHLLEFQVWPEL